MAKMGRPRLTTDPTIREALTMLLPAIVAGRISRREAAGQLRLDERTVRRYLAEHERNRYEHRMMTARV